MIKEPNYASTTTTSSEVMYDRVDELNIRLQNRHFSDMPLEPCFSPIPIQTKYSHFQIVNTRKAVNTPIYSELHHNVNFNFNPSTRNAPPSGYFNNIDDEIKLRNQHIKLSYKNDDVYVPSSKSDMYFNNLNFKQSDQNNISVHSLLFLQEPKYTKVYPQLSSIGTNTFFNHTRNQMKAL
jgi:hypothetical protein